MEKQLKKILHSRNKPAEAHVYDELARQPPILGQEHFNGIEKFMGLVVFETKKMIQAWDREAQTGDEAASGDFAAARGASGVNAMHMHL